MVYDWYIFDIFYKLSKSYRFEPLCLAVAPLHMTFYKLRIEIFSQNWHCSLSKTNDRLVFFFSKFS